MLPTDQIIAKIWFVYEYKLNTNGCCIKTTTDADRTRQKTQEKKFIISTCSKYLPQLPNNQSHRMYSKNYNLFYSKIATKTKLKWSKLTLSIFANVTIC